VNGTEEQDKAGSKKKRKRSQRSVPGMERPARSRNKLKIEKTYYEFSQKRSRASIVRIQKKKKGPGDLQIIVTGQKTACVAQAVKSVTVAIARKNKVVKIKEKGKGRRRSIGERERVTAITSDH